MRWSAMMNIPSLPGDMVLWRRPRKRWVMRLSEDELMILFEFCTGRELCALACCCKDLRDVLYREDGVWEKLYSNFKFVCKPQPPLFPNAGSWREAVVRANQNEVTIYIRPIGEKDRIQLTVDRKTTLYGLKKVVRQFQLRRYGIALDDFELLDLNTFVPLGVQGYDSLPPSDLSILFVSSDTILRSVRASEAFRQLLNRNQRPAWRKNLLYIPDGLELSQVFVSSSGSLQSFNAATSSLESGQRGLARQNSMSGPDVANNSSANIAELASRLVSTSVECPDSLKELGGGLLDHYTRAALDPNETDMNRKWRSFRNVCLLLSESNRVIQYLSYKPYWKHEFHPLIHILLTKTKANIPPMMRVHALIEFTREFVVHLVTKEFILNGMTRTFLGTGFVAVFVRLVVKIIPLILRTQIKQVMEGEIDWIPLIFATKFLLRITMLVGRSAAPIMVFAFAHQGLRTLLRSIFCEETERDDLVVYLLLFVLSKTIVPGAKARMSAAASKQPLPSDKIRKAVRNVGKTIGRFLNMDDTSSYAYLTKRMSDIILRLLERHTPWLFRWLLGSYNFLGKHPLLQYIISGLLWEVAERKVSHALLVSIPVYAYSVPFILSVMLIRLRIALSDSYYYMLYI